MTRRPTRRDVDLAISLLRLRGDRPDRLATLEAYRRKMDGPHEVTRARNRVTGTTIVVWDRGADREADLDPYRWETICEDHGFVCSHPTLALARRHAASTGPLDWCDDCAEEAS